MTHTPASGPNRLVTAPPIAAPSIVGAAGCWVGVCWARGRSGETLAAIARPSNNKIALLPVIASLCNCGSGWGLGRADIAHRIEIGFAQLRRQRPHVEGISTRLPLQPARSPLDLEIDVGYWSEAALVLIPGGHTAEGLYREAIGTWWQIAIGSGPRLAARDGLAVRVYDRCSESFPRVVVAQEPPPSHPRSERRYLRLRSRHVPRRRAGGRR